MFGRSWRIARLAGVDVRIDASWLVVVFLIVYSLYLRFTELYRGLSGGEAFGLAVFAAVLFFGSVLLHELAHSIAAVRRGIPVKSITLFMFGGATNARVDARGPGDEFIITAVGPATSVVLAVIFGLISVYARPVLSRPLAGMLGYIGWVNGALAAFNVVPGFPLDGGRILRSVIWKVTGSLARATRIASEIGRIVGLLIVAVGAYFFLIGGLITGLWLAAIGWFLAQAARASDAQMQVRRLLGDVQAGQVMARYVTTIPAEMNIRDAVHEYFMPYDRDAFPVERDGHIVGLVTLHALEQIPTDQWTSRTIAEAMVRPKRDAAVSPATPMEQVLTALEENDPVVVVQDDHILGIISGAAVARWVQRKMLLDRSDQAA